MLRNPTVPIGAISRFDVARFDGRWQVERAGAGEWSLAEFEVANGRWQERSGTGTTREAQVTPLGRGILQITYDDTTTRDLWVVWIDPDHNTAALGDPDGRFGFVVTRVENGVQIRSARQSKFWTLTDIAWPIGLMASQVFEMDMVGSRGIEPLAETTPTFYRHGFTVRHGEGNPSGRDGSEEFRRHDMAKRPIRASEKFNNRTRYAVSVWSYLVG